jgi:uncharacterized coiled-coil protein SlyX
MDQDLSVRLERIESNMAHLERLCEQLNEVLLDHSKQLTKVAAQQQRISETLEGMERERISATNPKPPHYK